MGEDLGDGGTWFRTSASSAFLVFPVWVKYISLCVGKCVIVIYKTWENATEEAMLWRALCRQPQIFDNGTSDMVIYN